MEASVHDPFGQAAADLARQADRPLPFAPAFKSLDLADPPGRTVAVDGSHAVLADTGAVWVVAVRAVGLTWPGPPLPPEQPLLHVATPDAASQQVADAYTAAGLEPPRLRGAEGYAEAWRTLAELQAALEGVASCSAGDLLLVDGALERLGDARAQAIADRIVEAARRRGVLAAGVAKRSRLHRDGMAIVPALQRAGPAGAWAVPVPDYQSTYVARLHPGAGFAFRVDVSHGDALDLLPGLCRDAVYLGYPYPLAAAHNLAAITGTETLRLRGRLEDVVRSQAGPAAAALLADFHETLDRNIP